MRATSNIANDYKSMQQFICYDDGIDLHIAAPHPHRAHAKLSRKHVRLTFDYVSVYLGTLL